MNGKEGEGEAGVLRCQAYPNQDGSISDTRGRLVEDFFGHVHVKEQAVLGGIDIRIARRNRGIQQVILPPFKLWSMDWCSQYSIPTIEVVS